MSSGAAQLLAQRGLQGASFAEVLELTGAPRGPIYHHFPDGKNQLVAITAGFLALWSDLLERAKLTAGCAVVAVSVAATGGLLDHAGDVFRRWTAELADLLHTSGLSKDDAVDFATLLISATEGAVIMSRAERTRRPFDRTAGLLTAEARRHAAGITGEAQGMIESVVRTAGPSSG